MKEVKFEKEIANGLRLGRNKILDKGKTLRVDVKRIEHWAKNRALPHIEFKITTYRRNG